MDCSIVVDSVELASSGKYKLYTCNTKWASYGKLISGKTITSVVENEYIQINSNTLPAAGTFTLANPFYYFGTFLDTNQELIKTKQSNDKLPFIYLHLNAPETFENDEAIVDFESDCSIYFMVDADPKNWLTGDHIENAIKPMRSLIKYFIKALKYYTLTDTTNITYTVNDYANFGQVQSDLGVVKQIFKDNISGSELLINIKFYKNLLCVCCN
jgi:hypothetical protein